MNDTQAHAGNENYDENFYRNITNAAVISAENMLPAIKKFIRPRSVIDVGCGAGSWLSVWQKHGVNLIVGLDGDYVDRSQLMIDEKNFYPTNLEENIHVDKILKKKLFVNKKFDLAMTLEVAEHLSPSRAESFVEDLTKLSDVIMFSAAIPGQGGTNHVNEQWQGYWAEKFSHFDYVCVDCLRPQIWSNNSISQHYRQNVFLYVQTQQLYRYPELQKYYLEHSDNITFDVIHPKVWVDMLLQFKQIYTSLKNSNS